MNNDTSRPIDLPIDLERLVEGELDKKLLPALISALDESPQQWRRLGLLVIEQQQFRRAVRASVEAPHTESISPRPPIVKVSQQKSADRTHRVSRQLLSRLTALAAALLIGLTIGAAWRHQLEDRFAVAHAASETNHTNTSAVESSDHIGQAASEAAVSTDDGSKADEPEAQPIIGLAQWHDGNSKVRSFPVLTAEGMTEQQLMNQRPFVSADDRQALIRKGWKVEFDRKVMSVELADGKKMMIPVDIVNYRPVARLIN